MAIVVFSRPTGRAMYRSLPEQTAEQAIDTVIRMESGMTAESRDMLVAVQLSDADARRAMIDEMRPIYLHDARKIGTVVFDQPSGGIPVGTAVSAGEGEDYDTGRVAEPSPEALAIPHAAGSVWVAWDSGVSTWTPREMISIA